MYLKTHRRVIFAKQVKVPIQKLTPKKIVRQYTTDGSL